LLPGRKADQGKQSYDHLLTTENRPLETIPLNVAATIHIWIGTKAETGIRNSWYSAADLNLWPPGGTVP